MGLKDIFGGERKGFQCQKNQDGSRTCDRFKVDGDDKRSTGTTVTIRVDPNTCKASLSGDVDSFLDDDMEDVAKLSKNMEAGCKKGIV